jgi:hypothetical protein
MPGGMIDSGMGLQSTAASGLARLSEQDQQRKNANQQLADQQKSQEIQMGASAASTAAMIGVMIAMAP